MPNQIEAKAIQILTDKLTEKGRQVKKSDNRTFDLIVDDEYSEVKSKGNCYNKLDFISFTDKQYAKIKSENFKIFLVCNVKNDKRIEIFEFESKQLEKIKPKKYTSYEYSKTAIQQVDKIQL